MGQQGEWTYPEPEERHAFSLCRVVDAGTADEWYDQLGVIRVTPDRRAPNRCAEQLHPWALATLRAGGYGFGRYYAALSILDEDDEPSRPIRQEHIDWSGTTALAPETTALAPETPALAPETPALAPETPALAPETAQTATGTA